MSESAELSMGAEMRGEEELRMRISAKEPSIHTISTDELREISHYPEKGEDRERDVMGGHVPDPITGSSIFIASESGDVTPEMAACLLSHEMMHHVLLAEVGLEASLKYDAVADDYHEGFKE